MGFIEKFPDPDRTQTTPSSKKNKRYRDIEEFPDPSPDPSETLIRKEEHLDEKEEIEARAREFGEIKMNKTIRFDLSRPPEYKNQRLEGVDNLPDPEPNLVCNDEHSEEERQDKKITEEILKVKSQKEWADKPIKHKSPRNQGRKPKY